MLRGGLCVKHGVQKTVTRTPTNCHHAQIAFFDVPARPRREESRHVGEIATPIILEATTASATLAINALQE
jgi:hypothetical protein